MTPQPARTRERMPLLVCARVPDDSGAELETLGVGADVRALARRTVRA